MRRTWVCLLLLIGNVASQSRPLSAGEFEWLATLPHNQGISTSKLDCLADDLAGRNTAAFLVIRNDQIVKEWYAAGRSAVDRHGTASLAKALVGGLSLAVAITDGLISVDDKASAYVPQWKHDPLKAKIAIRHLGSHTSGLDDSRPNKEAKWKDDFWQQLDPPGDPFSISRDTTPVLFEPGEKLQYSNPGIGMLTYAVTAAIRSAPINDVRTLLRERIMQPIGVRDEEWECGYNKTFDVEGLALVGSWGGGAYSPRAVARIGRLVLREGDWEGRRLLSKEAVRQVIGDAGLPGNCGMGWWTNGGGRYADLPRDAVWGVGAGHQILLVVPSLNLVVVRMGSELGQHSWARDFEPSMEERLFKPLMAAIDRGQVSAQQPSEFRPRDRIRGGDADKCFITLTSQHNRPD